MPVLRQNDLFVTLKFLINLAALSGFEITIKVFALKTEAATDCDSPFPVKIFPDTLKSQFVI
jgi:hypothetical protein